MMLLFSSETSPNPFHSEFYVAKMSSLFVLNHGQLEIIFKGDIIRKKKFYEVRFQYFQVKYLVLSK
jgi:hypothetical protein